MKLLSKRKQTRKGAASDDDSADRPARELIVEMFDDTHEAPKLNEHRLVRKVLMLALLDLLGRKRIERVDAWRFVFYGTEHPFSFDNCCGWLKLDAEAMRTRYRQMMQEKNPVRRAKMRRIISAVLSS